MHICASYGHVTPSSIYTLFNGINEWTDRMIYKNSKRMHFLFKNRLIWSSHYCIVTQCQRRSGYFSTPEFTTESLIPLFSLQRTPQKGYGLPSCSEQSTVSQKKYDKVCILPRSQQLHPDKQFTLTMVFLAQQVFCGWKEHFHKFWNLPDDMNCTQRCLSTQKTLNEEKKKSPFRLLTANVQHTRAAGYTVQC